MKIAKYILLFFTLISLLTGCVSSNSINKQIAQCPAYFQDNVGIAKVLPFWYVLINLTGGPTGWCDKNTGDYYLSPLANKYVVWHEAFHSFYILTYKNRQDEWQRFTQDFGIATPDPLIYFTCILIPFTQDIPVPGYVRLYGLSNGAEDSADTFAFWMCGKQRKDAELQRKISTIKDYVNGEYNWWKSR